MRWRAAALLLVTVSCTVPGDGTTRAAITEGTISGDDGVVALAERRVLCPPGHSVGVFCSGVLIAPRVVLTAAHCVVDRSIDELEIVRARSTEDPSAFHARPIGVRIHPAFDPETREGDVALIGLADAVDVPPLPFTGEVDLVDGDIGGTLRIVGHGSPAAGLDGGQLRWGTSRIGELTPTAVRVEPAPSLPCDADSGGALFLEREGVEHLVAITRSGDAACATFGVGTRLSAYADFIGGALAELEAEPVVDDLGDPSLDYCSAPCVDGSECPYGMRCLRTPEGDRCGYAAVRPATFADACASDADCGGSEGCLAFGAGQDQRCVCATSCAPADDDPGGCQVSASRSTGAGPWPGAILALLLALALRRRRSRVGLAVLLGVVAGCTCEGTSPPDTVALLDGEPILESEVRPHLRQPPPPLDGEPAADPHEVALEAAIRVRLFEREARRRGLEVPDGPPNVVRSRLVAALRTAELDAVEPPTDAEGEAYLREHPEELVAPERVVVQAIAVDDAARGEAVAAEAAAAGDEATFLSLARQHDVRASPPEGARLGTLHHGEGLDEPLARVASLLRTPGRIGGPVAGSDGRFYVLRAEEVELEEAAFEGELATRTRNALRELRGQAILDALHRRLRDAARIEVRRARLESLPLPADE